MSNSPSDGPLSDFDAPLETFDEFRIKTPFTGDTTDTDSLEQANDWNHMFDAAIKTQKYAKGVSLGNYYTADPAGTEAVASTVARIDVDAISATSTNASFTMTGTVPADFGTNPFLSSGFSMMLTPSYTSGSKDSAFVGGLNTSGPLAGYSGVESSETQVVWSVKPTVLAKTGSGYTVTGKLIKPATIVEDGFRYPLTAHNSTSNRALTSISAGSASWNSLIPTWDVYCSRATGEGIIEGIRNTYFKGSTSTVAHGIFMTGDNNLYFNTSGGCVLRKAMTYYNQEINFTLSNFYSIALTTRYLEGHIFLKSIYTSGTDQLNGYGLVIFNSGYILSPVNHTDKLRAYIVKYANYQPKTVSNAGPVSSTFLPAGVTLLGAGTEVTLDHDYLSSVRTRYRLTCTESGGVNTITLWKRVDNGSWTSVVSGTDSAYLTAGSYNEVGLAQPYGWHGAQSGEKNWMVLSDLTVRPTGTSIANETVAFNVIYALSGT